MSITHFFLRSEPKKKSTPEAPKSESPVDITRIDLRIGRIVKAEKHPDADSLYIEEVETGEEKNRTVISGLVKFIPVEEVVLSNCIFFH